MFGDRPFRSARLKPVSFAFRKVLRRTPLANSPAYPQTGFRPFYLFNFCKEGVYPTKDRALPFLPESEGELERVFYSSTEFPQKYDTIFSSEPLTFSAKREEPDRAPRNHRRHHLVPKAY